MKTRLLISVFKFPAVRTALKKEAVRFLLGLVIGLAAVGLMRWYLDWGYSRDGLISLAIGIVAWVAMWSISVVRTMRAVLRENGLLER